MRQLFNLVRSSFPYEIKDGVIIIKSKDLGGSHLHREIVVDMPLGDINSSFDIRVDTSVSELIGVNPYVLASSYKDNLLCILLDISSDDLIELPKKNTPIFCIKLIPIVKVCVNKPTKGVKIV